MKDDQPNKVKAKDTAVANKRREGSKFGGLHRFAFMGHMVKSAVAATVLPRAAIAAVPRGRTTLVIIGDSTEVGFFIGRADAEPTNIVHTGLCRKNGTTGTMFAALA